MNIRNAAIQAHKEGKGIARMSDGTRPLIFIGTNTTNRFLILHRNDVDVSTRWTPSLDDITAKDWYVIG